MRNFIGDRDDTVILAVGGGSCIDLAKVRMPIQTDAVAGPPWHADPYACMHACMHACMY